MTKLNMKTPLVFRTGILLLCLFLLSFSMMGGLYAKFSASAEAKTDVKAAGISYKLSAPSEVSSHQLDMNALPDSCKIVAVDEAFVLENDGEVAYTYTINLTLTASADYQLTSPANTVWLLSDGQEATVANGMFYHSLNDGALEQSTKPTLAGALGIGEKAVYKFYYFVNFENASLGQEIVINYDIRCEQID